MSNEIDVDCGSGWRSIIDPLISFCQKKGIPVAQVKEKFGGLRFYVDYPESLPEADRELFDKLVDAAELLSFHICEVCGRPGRRRGGGWIKTLCDEHDKSLTLPAAKRKHEWIAVDLDGTLAYYDGFKGPDVIGDPIPTMAERVLRWTREGFKVVIFTARVSHPADGGQCKAAVEAWLQKHGLPALEVTCTKDYRILEFWDDRAVQVETNTARILGYSKRGLS